MPKNMDWMKGKPAEDNPSDAPSFSKESGRLVDETGKPWPLPSAMTDEKRSTGIETSQTLRALADGLRANPYTRMYADEAEAHAKAMERLERRIEALDTRLTEAERLLHLQGVVDGWNEMVEEFFAGDAA